MPHAVDGTLASWDDLDGDAAWPNLLVGNGLSIHLCRDFAYPSLFARACELGLLGDTESAVFAAFDTQNFERVLSALSTAMTLAEAIGDPYDHLLDRYRSVQVALGAAVREAHPDLKQFDWRARRQLRQVLRRYRRVFTTSYDLAIYWTTAAGGGSSTRESFAGFKDRFWGDGMSFDPANTTLRGPRATEIFYVHGALHLVVDKDGVTRKRTQGSSTILAQFGEPIGGPRRERPLLISEGESVDKLRAIQENDYLQFALRRLRRVREPIAVFGHSLSAQDAHLVRALNDRPGRKVAVAVRDNGPAANRRRQAELTAALPDVDLSFFDSASHPLAASAHRMRDC